MERKYGAECLIVGLGNPGAKYGSTPHNLGFLAVDRLASKEGITIVRQEVDCIIGKGNIAGKTVVLAKPLTFMNNSGVAVRELLIRYSLKSTDMLVVFDDLALPWSSLRLRLAGSSGGHKGVQSVIEKVGTAEFPRLRLGIHPGEPYGDGADFVLRPFVEKQKEGLYEILNRAASAVRLFLSSGAAKAMTEVNCRADGDLEVK